MTNVSSNWQDSINHMLVNRLIRPLRQPGVMKMAMGQQIISRSDRFLNRVPLLTQQMQRWGNTNSLSYDPVPIVYAQPILSSKEQDIGTGKDNVLMSNLPKNQPSVPIVQGKEGEKIINSTTAADIPVVSPQPISEELVNSSSMPLQAKFIEPQNSSATGIDPNVQIESSSRVEGEKILNSTTAADIPVVSAQPISEELVNSSSMPLQAKFIEPQNSSATGVEPNVQTSIFSSDIPVVSPQLISEKFVNSSSMPLAEELTTRSELPLPIIPAKKQNSDLSSSSLPMVNPLNAFGSLKQPQKDINYSTKRKSIKPINLKSQSSFNNLPIVTTQPLISQVNFTEKKIPMLRDSPNSQNTSFHISKSEIPPSNRHQMIYPLITPITSPMNSQLQSQPLPLATNTSNSNTIGQEHNNSKQTGIKTNTNSFSSPRILANLAPKTETYVSPMANGLNSKIDVDAIANKVERKIMRRLVIESERRGKRG